MTEDEITLLQKRVRIAEESIVPSWQDVADRWMKACIEHESTIADLRGEPVEQLLRHTRATSRAFFRLDEVTP